MRILTYVEKEGLNAGPKAPKDIISILKEQYNVKSIEITKSNVENKFYINKERCRKIYKIIENSFGNDVTIIQHPFLNMKNVIKIMKKSVTFIHDLDSLRYKKNNSREIETLKNYKVIISHNKKMTEYLREKGLKNKIYELELFDYLCENINVKNKFEKENKLEVIYAGNLIKEKSPFIYQIDNEKINYKINLYGNGIERDISNNIKYIGAFCPEELPNKIQGNLGLVWDGNYDESDENEGFKNYTKYNNPHKLSCYIAAGIPVIVWRKSAIADLVDKYNIGYKISNIYDINKLDLSDYDEKLKNVQELSPKVRQGYFTKRVINEILADIEKTQK